MRSPGCRIPALVCLVVALLVLPAFAPRAEAAPDPGQKGPYAVGFTNFMLFDPSRPGDGGAFEHRPIPVYVWYPVDAAAITTATPEAIYQLDPLYTPSMISTSSDWEKYGMDAAYQGAMPSANRPFPLLMFSPGWGGAAWIHMSVGTRLASHGFVVAVVYHFGDQWWPWEPPFDHLALASWNRPLDISFALTDLLEKSATCGEFLQGMINPDQVAAGGWSLGGYAAMSLAAGDDSVCDAFDGPDFEWMGPVPPHTCAPAYPDTRIKAIVPHDGSNQVLSFAELTRVAVPAMGMGEEWSMLAANMAPPWDSWQARQHAAFSGHPGYRVDVYNTSHQSFSDICETLLVLDDLGYYSLLEPYWGPLEPNLGYYCYTYAPATDIHRLVGKYTVAFLKTNLVGETGYQSILTPGSALNNEPLIEFFVTEKRDPNAIGTYVEGDVDWPIEFVYFMHQSGSAQARAIKDPTVTFSVPRVPPGGGRH